MIEKEDLEKRDNKVGKDGKKRPLRIDKALAIAKYESETDPRQPIRVITYKPRESVEELIRYEYFEKYRILLFLLNQLRRNQRNGKTLTSN